MNPVWTLHHAAQALSLRDDGLSDREIGLAMGITKSTVTSHFNRLGLFNKGRFLYWPEGKKTRFKTLWLDGCPPKSIARAMDITTTQVHSQRRYMNLPGQREGIEKKGLELPSAKRNAAGVL